MSKLRKRLPLLALVGLLAIILDCAVGYAAYTAFMPGYTVAALDWARGQGVYDTPEQGVIDRAYRDYCGVERVVIEQAATNSFDGSDPHIWFVLYRVYAGSHAPCGAHQPRPTLYHGTFENGGSYFLHTKDGWVRMPEGRFPELIGHWMKKLDLAGPGNPYHIPREW